jgi:surfeit locus 1 family protein
VTHPPLPVVEAGIKSGWRRAFFLVFVLVTTLILGTLGAWQWQRRGEKAAFIAALTTADSASPLPYSASQMWDRVRITGRFLHEKSVMVNSSQPEGGFGVYVMTPLVYARCGTQAPCGEGIALINRGFVPITPGQPMPVIAKPEEEITLTGIRRPAEREGLLPPHNTPGKGQYFYRDTRQMAAALQLGIAGDDFIDRLDAPGDPLLPKGLAIKALVASIPNNHLSYALTWWGLALTNLGVAGFFMFARRRAKPV